MPHSHPLDVTQLREGLKAARRRGVAAARLVNHAPLIVDVLYPEADYPGVAILDRAMAAENLIVAAVGALDDESRHLSAILLGMTRDGMYSTLQKRREQAAEHVGVLPQTWERGWRERQLFDDLAIQIFRLHQDSADAYLPARN